MKSFALATVAFASAASAQNLFEQILGDDAIQYVQQVTDSVDSLLMDASDKIGPLSQTVSKNKFGCVVEQTIFAHPHTEKVITAPLVPYHMDYVQQEAHLRDSIDRHAKKVLQAANGPVTPATCSDRSPASTPSDFGMFLPVFAAQVDAANPTGTYAGHCFEEITFEYEPIDETSFNVNVTTSKPKSHLCKDVILFANTEIQHFEVFFFHGTHKLTFQMNTPEAQADVGFGGIKAFAFCENVIQDVESLWTTLKGFVGGITDHPKWPIIGSHVPPYMEKVNVEFIKENIGVTL